jgi:hypothetical protein
MACCSIIGRNFSLLSDSCFAIQNCILKIRRITAAAVVLQDNRDLHRFQIQDFEKLSSSIRQIYKKKGKRYYEVSNDMPFYYCYLTIKSIAANLCELSVKGIAVET